MTQWHSVNLGDALLAGTELARIERDFDRAYAREGEPEHMAMFIRHVSEGQLHCDVIVYFSPAASPVAREAFADPCPPPLPQGLGLLRGSEDAWELLGEDKGAASRRG